MRKIKYEPAGKCHTCGESAKELAFAGVKPPDVADADHENLKVIKDHLQEFIRELTEPTTK